ncbi:NrdH-redoxin [Bifidobacterium aemilianum]|uniref:Glutaredoxin-like protein NrdH n=1 Tax=Bifidobacterium aemilianum TaxID=2493120 RepID=A0A366K8H6_9BIFI|nr:glutaredoxin-like protein NrdH [Bifidobacterium aemilianum]RBP97969.1 NrdH-redoxin [Bifidobacterium aemilianum]
MTVTVFTKPRCPQCEATKRQLTRQGVDFETVDLTENPATLDQLQEAGFRQAPVVITPDASWSGYRPDLIKALVKQDVTELADHQVLA